MPADDGPQSHSSRRRSNGRHSASAHSESSGAAGSSRSRMLRGGAIALVLLLAGGGGLVWAGTRSGGPAKSPASHAAADTPAGTAADPSAQAHCAERPRVKVAVPIDLYDVVAGQARALEAAGTCSDYVVTRDSAGQVAERIGASRGSAPDVWISDSSIWVANVAGRLGSDWAAQGPTLATSPVLFAVPKSLQNDPAATEPSNWSTVFTSGLPITVSDPTNDSTTIVAAAASAAASNGTAQQQSVTRAFVTLSRASKSPAYLVQQAAQGAPAARVFPTTEQQVLSFDRDHPDERLGTYLPTPGAPSLRYEWVVPARKAGPAAAAAIAALRERLTSTSAKRELVGAGFRVPGQAPPSPSALPPGAQAVPPPDQAQSIAILRNWQDLAKDARMLVMLDVSGSMLDPIAPGMSRIQLLKQFSFGALTALPATTEMGAMAFSTDLVGTQPWRDESDGVASIAHTPAGDAQRARLVAAANSLPGLAARNGDTALYDSTWAAYQQVSKGYDPRYSNSVVILTDGDNDEPAGGMSLATLMSKLRAAYNPDKPVKIVCIGIGNQIDRKALASMASATHGLSYQALTPAAVTRVFLDAFLKRS